MQVDKTIKLINKYKSLNPLQKKQIIFALKNNEKREPVSNETLILRYLHLENDISKLVNLFCLLFNMDAYKECYAYFYNCKDKKDQEILKDLRNIKAKTSKLNFVDDLLTQTDFIYYNIQKYNCQSLMDFGCGNGSKTLQLKKLLNIDTVIGIDIENWDQKLVRNDTQLNIFLYDKDKMNFPIINPVDLITCIHVLHHIEKNKLKKIIQYFYDSLKNDGYLVIFEHDVIYESDFILVDLEHYYFEWLNKNPFHQNYNMHYFNFFEIIHMFRKKFKFLKSIMFERHVLTNKYTKPNMSRLYIFQKKSI